MVSIPSNGSIQFLRNLSETSLKRVSSQCLNPLKRVNSILTKAKSFIWFCWRFRSQSPQTGQFNSYANKSLCYRSHSDSVSIPSNGSIQFLHKKLYLTENKDVYLGLNPLKRVNSILTASI